MKFKPSKSIPMKIVLLTLAYLLSGCGILAFLMNEYIQDGCTWKRIAFYAVGIAVCIFASWMFLCGEKFACAFMLGISVYGTIYCMAVVLSGGSWMFSLAEFAFLAVGVLTFFSGRYFVEDGIGYASTVQSMFIVLGSGICLIPVCSFLITGSGAFEALSSCVCAFLFCQHAKIGKLLTIIYMLIAVLVYGISFYLVRNVFFLFIALCYAALLAITYTQRDYFVFSLKSKERRKRS